MVERADKFENGYCGVHKGRLNVLCSNVIYETVWGHFILMNLYN